jgi:hypothetical protein
MRGSQRRRQRRLGRCGGNKDRRGREFTPRPLLACATRAATVAPRPKRCSTGGGGGGGSSGTAHACPRRLLRKRRSAGRAAAKHENGHRLRRRRGGCCSHPHRRWCGCGGCGGGRERPEDVLRRRSRRRGCHRRGSSRGGHAAHSRGRPAWRRRSAPAAARSKESRGSGCSSSWSGGGDSRGRPTSPANLAAQERVCGGVRLAHARQQRGGAREGGGHGGGGGGSEGGGDGGRGLGREVSRCCAGALSDSRLGRCRWGWLRASGRDRGRQARRPS